MLHIFGDIEAYSYKYYLRHGKVKEYIVGSKTKETGDILIATTIYEWLGQLEQHVKDQEQSALVYFHNGSGYDFQFILPHILDMYPTQEGAKKQRVTYFIDDKNKIFEIKYQLRWKVKQKNGQYKWKKATVKFVDSWKIWPFKLAQMGEAVGMPKLDYGEYDILDEFNSIEDYKQHNNGKSYEYFIRDIEIMEKFADETEPIMSLDDYSLTMASTAMKTWKKTNDYFGKQIQWWTKFEKGNLYEYKNDIETWTLVKKAYKGGITYVNPKYQLEELKNVYIYDINSMYPGIMYNEKMPYGRPEHDINRVTEYHTYQIWRVDIKRATTQKMPFVPKPEKTSNDLNQDVLSIMKGLSEDRLVETDYDTQYPTTLENCTIYMNNYTLDLFEENYQGEWETTFECAYQETYDVFKEYIEQFKTLKETSKGAIRELAKLFLNSLYGKFGQNIDDLCVEILDKNDIKLTQSESGLVFYHQGERVTVNGGLVYKKKNNGIRKNISFIPMAEAITSKARVQLVKAINANWDNFVYCDTDSIHLLHEAKGIKIHPTNFGDWKFEGCWDTGVYRRAKHYLHTGLVDEKTGGVLNDTYDLKGGGFNVSRFNEGGEDFMGITVKQYLQETFTIPNGKTESKIVDGGVVIREIDYKFTMPTNYKGDGQWH